MHWCGNPFHDVPMFLWVLAMEAPFVSQALLWLRLKFQPKPRCGARCDHTH